MHALIIEDEFLAALTLEDMLLELGVETCDWAATEAAAIDAAARHKPDVIAANIQLRYGDSVEVVREICENCDIPTILVSATDVHLRDDIANAVIVPKPLNARTFRAAFKKAVASATQSQDAEHERAFFA